MKPIVTLTLNPAIDAACQADKVQPIHKIRTFAERFDPGGGGINVARVIRELGGEALAVHTAGGITGGALDELLDASGLPHRAIPIAGATRISYVVHERSSGHEYRFVPEGPKVDQRDLDACFDAIASVDAEYVVVSGSVPRGLAPDCYVSLAALAASKGARLVLDTSGEALRRTLDAGIYLVKPNLRELAGIVGRSLASAREQEAAAQELVAAGKAAIVTVSLGADGALLATETGCLRLKGPDVMPKSAVGAGDSFVGAMTLALAQGRPPADAFAFAVAAGTATVLTMGTELCRGDDVERIYHQIVADQGPISLA